MTGVIVTGHGTFSEGLISAVDLLGGNQEYLKYVNFTADMSTEALREQLSHAVLEFTECKSILILCDLVGGSPFKEAAVLASEKSHIAVIGGANMPALIEAVFSRTVCADERELAELCLKAAAQSVQIFAWDEEKTDFKDDEL